MQGVLKKARPGRIEDLIALNALYRPGAMEHIDTFVREQVGPEVHRVPAARRWRAVLKETYGVPVYQEQVMEMAQVVAGFSLGQADILRRAMGKKKPEEMLKMKEMFLAGAKANGYDAKTGERIFELLFAFSGYGFNKSHAAAYAIPAYHTIWLKANHPAEFIAANCTNDMNDTDRMAAAHPRGARDGHRGAAAGREPLHEGVHGREREDRLRPPGDQERRLRAPWTRSSPSGSAPARSRACWTSLTRIDSHEVNRKVAESLIITGAFDRLGETRATLSHNLDRIMEVSVRAPGGEAIRPGLALRGRGRRRPRPTWRWSVCPSGPRPAPAPGGAPQPRLLLLGAPAGPLAGDSSAVRSPWTSRARRRSPTTGPAPSSAMLSDVREIRTRNGRTMAFAQLEDFKGSIELILFSDIYREPAGADRQRRRSSA